MQLSFRAGHLSVKATRKNGGAVNPDRGRVLRGLGQLKAGRGLKSPPHKGVDDLRGDSVLLRACHVLIVALSRFAPIPRFS